jgi:YqcI/YcgG family
MTMALSIRILQQAVDRTVQENGGYWRPASAAFNLYEELLALDEATYPAVLENGQLAPVDPEEVQRHLVKLFVAATCIATQYSVDLLDSFRDLGLDSDLEDESFWEKNEPNLRLAVLSVKRRVAQVARVVTLYDFEDVSVDSPDMPKISRTVPLLLVDVLKGFDSAAEFRAGIYANLSGPRSPRRYVSPFDPGTAPVLRKIAPIRDATFCPFAKRSRLWGAPDFDPSMSFDENMHRSVNSLRVFIRVAQREPLDGFVYGFPVDPDAHTLEELQGITARFIFFLTRTCNRQSKEQLQEDIRTDPKWRFRIYGEECFVNVFSPIYSSTHSRFTYAVRDMMFIMLQPETSFHSLIKKQDFQTQRDRIRAAFESRLQGYILDDSEANRFVLPIRHSDEPVSWYR